LKERQMAFECFAATDFWWGYFAGVQTVAAGALVGMMLSGRLTPRWPKWL
jgi:hypothetical protein